jgi:hypothetical protein
MRTVPLGPVAAVLLALASCAVGRQPSTAQGSAGAQPGFVRSFMTTDLAFRPIPAERLADPAVRAAAEACERAGRPHCREYVVATDQRQSFKKGLDPKALAVLQLGQLSAGEATYEVACRFVDPAGSAVTTLRHPVVAPPGLPPGTVMTSSCVMNLTPGTQEGGWTVEFDVNGERAAVLRFEVLAAAGAGSA